jgi:hypothetical protein
LTPSPSEVGMPRTMRSTWRERRTGEEETGEVVVFMQAM